MDVLANPFGPSTTIVGFHPFAVGGVEVEGDTAEWVIGRGWHQDVLAIGPGMQKYDIVGPAVGCNVKTCSVQASMEGYTPKVTG